jgi:glycosyltransferase involved in cell wall biosynthesis
VASSERRHRSFDRGGEASPDTGAGTARRPRPRILVVSDFYLPGYRGGGPIRTIANLIDHLAEEFDFSIVTRDRDLGDQFPFPGISPGRWERLGAARVLYQPPRHRGIRSWIWVLRQTEHDLLYLNSLFSRATIRILLARRLGAIPRRPLVLAPRGELSPGALALKQIRKRVFVTLGRWVGLFNDVVWQASTERERGEILDALSVSDRVPTDVQSAPNLLPHVRVEVGMDLPPRQVELPAPPPPKQPGEARAVFVSRISRKKNLHFALKFLTKVHGRVVFDIYGPREDVQYWAQCEALMTRLPAHVRARYCGDADPRSIVRLFSQYDVLLFPTLSENFGYVILEAWQGGCPVLLSDTTPWRDLAADKAGWDLPLDDPPAFVAALQQVVDMDQGEHARWRAGALARARAVGDDRNAVSANRELFMRALRRQIASPATD